MIERIIIENYKSIRKMDLRLEPINILIGANGAGKSNFISFFELARRVFTNEIEQYSKKKLAGNLLYHGLKHSGYISGLLDFDNIRAFSFKLTPQNDESLWISQYGIRLNIHQSPDKNYDQWNESKSSNDWRENLDKLTENHVDSFRIYHFHDTSDTSPMKQSGPIDDNQYLRKDAGNLAAFLYLLREKHPQNFRRIEMTIRSVAPFFEKFDLKPRNLNPDQIKLEWKEQDSDMYLDAHNFSDGTLRFIALVALLMQPDPPKTIIIDEPELGLHPVAINKIAALIQKVSDQSQVIVSTQSVELVNQFAPEEIITVDREEGQSVFHRLDGERVQDWLEEFSLGDIWQKNIIGGQP